MAEIRGIPDAVLREFSTRRCQVVEQLSETGAVGWRAAQIAAIQTRDPKAPIDLEVARADWWARAQEHGLGRRDLERVLGRARWTEPTAAEVRTASMALIGPEGLTRTATTFSEADVASAWAQALPRGVPADRIRELTARLLDLPAVEAIDDEPALGRSRRFTTRQVIELEERALAIAEGGIDAGAPVASTTRAAELSVEQTAMVRQVCKTPDRVVCAVGLAGAGKTTATRAVAETMTREGFLVLGVAPSGVAAERLQDDVGIRSTTIHRLLIEERHLPERAVVVLDEAGMADTRSLAELLERVERARGKLILIGDPKQLASVGPGGLFPALVERLARSRATREPSPTRPDPTRPPRRGPRRSACGVPRKRCPRPPTRRHRAPRTNTRATAHRVVEPRQRRA